MTDQVMTMDWAAPGDGPAARIESAFRKEVMTGLRYSTRARSAALAVIAILVAVQNWAQSPAEILYFEVIIALFVLLGVAHYQLAKSPLAHASHKYLFTLADILLFAVLEFGASVGQGLDAKCERLQAWYARVAARPAMAT